MTLRELEATFIKYGKDIATPNHGRPLADGTMQWGGFEVNTQIEVESIEEAQGLIFLCPQCYNKNSGSKGTHQVHISFADRGVPIEQGSKNDKGEPSRWTIIGGSSLDDLQLSPSIFLNTSCQWHGFIGNSGVPAGSAN